MRLTSILKTEFMASMQVVVKKTTQKKPTRVFLKKPT